MYKAGRAIVSAVISYRLNAQGELLATERVKRIDDSKGLERLLRFFPEFKTGKWSGTAGGWIAGVVIRFMAADGVESIVYVDPELRAWREETGGDWRVDRGFGPYIKRMFDE